MANDTASTDPTLMEEARRAAAEAALPKTPAVDYVPRTIFFECWNRIVDSKYAPAQPEESLTNLGKDLDGKEVIGTLTEAEYRSFCESFCYATQSIGLQLAAAKLRERATAIRTVMFCSMRERLGLEDTVPTSVDARTGQLRKTPEAPQKENRAEAHTLDLSSNPILSALFGLKR